MIKVTGTAPEFGNSPMVAERVSIHGHISLMEPVEQLPALDPEWTPKIGRIRTDGPVLKWLEKRAEWDKDFESALKKHRAIRIKNREEAEKHGFLTGDLYGENPPMCALVSLSDPKLARRVAKPVDEPTTSVSKGVALWMKLGERADEQAEEHADKRTYYRESWTDKVSRRASQIFSRDSEEKERRKSSDNRLSNGHSEKAKQVANGERRTSSEGRRPSASASAPALASGNANAITVETETEGRETARAASPSADPIADAFSKLTATPTKTPVQPPTPTVQPPTPSSGTEPAVVAVAAKDAESETTPGQSADLTPVSEPTEAASALSL
jgi:hypothetical protein